MKGGRFMIVFALITGLLAAVIAYIYLGNAARPASVPSKSVTVVAAKSAIPPRTKISNDLVYVKEVPEAAVHPRAARDVMSVLGLMTKHEILEGETIIMDRLYGLGEPVGLASSVPRDKRAITVPVNEVVGVAGFVKPGDRVDVIATASGTGQTGDVAFTVIEDVEVLAVAQESEDRNQGKAKVSSSVTLACTPAGAERLALAEEMGSLRLVLRPVDASATRSAGVVAHDLLREVRGWSPPRPAIQSAAPQPVASLAYPGGVSPGPAVTSTRQAPPTPVAYGPATAPKVAGSSAPERVIVEVIKGSDRDYVTLSSGGEATAP